MKPTYHTTIYQFTGLCAPRTCDTDEQVAEELNKALAPIEEICLQEGGIEISRPCTDDSKQFYTERVYAGQNYFHGITIIAKADVFSGATQTTIITANDDKKPIRKLKQLEDLYNVGPLEIRGTTEEIKPYIQPGKIYAPKDL